MYFKSLNRLVLTALVLVAPISHIPEVDASQAVNEHRAVVISKSTNDDIETLLRKYQHKKVKRLSHLKEAEVVLVSDEVLARLETDSSVQVYEDAIVKVEEPRKGIRSKGEVQPWGIERVGANQIWRETTGKGVTVAVIDSGISKHKDLKKNINGGFNAIDSGKSPDDDYGHGTHVAGVIASIDNNSGVIGIAPDVELYAVKVLDGSGSGYLSDLVEGIEWSIQNGIQVINLSLELHSDIALLKKSIDRAIDAGIIVVAAAGNTYGMSSAYPAAYQDVISVSAIDNVDQLANFSAIGKVDFAAPGVDIYSTYVDNGYESLSGTSMAAPHVTGVVALMLADRRNDSDLNGTVTATEVYSRLIKYAEEIGDEGYDAYYGYGIVKAIE